MLSILRHRTAIKRADISRPVRLALEHGVLSSQTSFFDYGCGYGNDVDYLSGQGINAEGWDPIHRPKGERRHADVVNLGYVVNVIEDVAERSAVLRDAWSLAQKLLIVSARLAIEVRSGSGVSFYADGLVTRRGTFQKFYEQSELRDWISAELAVPSVAAAPGVFYIFRDQSLAQSFVASRFRRSITAPRAKKPLSLFEDHKGLLDPLIAFVSERGRLPGEGELLIASEIKQQFGSLAKAFALIQKVTGGEQWERILQQRSSDLLVYLALSRFGGRPRVSDLPDSIRQDVKTFFSNYTQACRKADELLFSVGRRDVIQSACQSSSIGKQTADALYVHTSALSQLTPVLRVYEGCARAYVGAVEGANIVKMHRLKPQISYLQYPEFETDPHPALAASLKVPLNTFHIDYREYKDSRNPFILHRKETMLAPDHPLKNKFARLTAQEEKKGLYEAPQLIGTREGWQKILEEKEIYYSGHKLMCRRHK